MTQYGKISGLALLAMLALSICATPGAHATSFTAAEYPVSVVGTQIGENQFSLGIVRFFRCLESDFTGSLGGPETVLETTASYSKCSSYISGEATTIDMNSCYYTMIPVTPIESSTTGEVKTAVDCKEAGDAIHITNYKNSVHTEGNIACTYAISAQGPSGIGQFHNIGSGTTGEVELTLNIQGIAAKVILGAKVICTASTGESVNFTYLGNTRLTASSGKGKGHVGIMVGH